MRQKALYAVILCALVAGTSGLLIKHMSTLTPGAMAWFRAIIPGTFITLLLIKNKISFFRGNYKKMLVASTINAVRIYLYFLAFIFTSIGNAIILFYSWPIFASIMGFVFLKENISKYQFVLLFMAFAGLILAYSNKTFSFEDQDFIGMLAAIGAAIGYAITVILYKSESKFYHQYELIFFQNFSSALIYFPFFLINFPDTTWNHLGTASFYAFLIGVGVFGLFFYGLKHLKASTASSLMYLEVVSAIILGYLVLGEELRLNVILGGGLILLSSFLLTRSGQ